MTKEAALYNFWSMFGLPAYEENAVPSGEDGAEFPYITYQVVTDSFGNNVSLTGSVWYRSTSWKEANAKAQEIANLVGHGYTILCDGGSITMSMGHPAIQSLSDPDDATIKRRYLNITAIYNTLT